MENFGVEYWKIIENYITTLGLGVVDFEQALVYGHQSFWKRGRSTSFGKRH